MRVNVYSQELTTETELVTKTGVNAAGESETFYGVRLYLRSPKELHHTVNDDDRSAVTFWVPKSEHRRNDLFNAFQELAWLVGQAGLRVTNAEPDQAASVALDALRGKLAGSDRPAQPNDPVSRIERLAACSTPAMHAAGRCACTT